MNLDVHERDMKARVSYTKLTYTYSFQQYNTCWAQIRSDFYDTE